ERVTIDTGATGDEALFSAKTLSGTLDLAALGGAITVAARNLAITANGKLASYDDPDTAGADKFIVEVFFGGTFKEKQVQAGPDGEVGTDDDIITVVDSTKTGAAAPDSEDLDFEWPSWMPLKLRHIALEWEDV